MPGKFNTLEDHASRGDEAGVRIVIRTQQHPPEVLTNALLQGAAQGHAAVCRALLQAGADPNLPALACPHPATPALPPSSPSLAVAPPLTRHQMRTRCGWEALMSVAGTALHRAVEGGHVQCMLVLLDGGADPGRADARGVPAFCLAALRPAYLQVLEAMLGTGRCAVDMRDPQRGRTAMHCAALTANVGALKLLCEAGAAINVRDLRGNTPLILAARALRVKPLEEGGHTSDPLEAMTYLLARGANVRLVSREGGTALRHAVEARHTPAVRLLVSHGALVSFHLLQYASMVLQDAKVMEQLLQGPQVVDATMAAILVSLIGSRPSKWTFANSEQEWKSHEISRLVLAGIRDVEVCNSLLLSHASRSVLLSGLPSNEDASKAEKVIEQFGIIGYALLNGKFSTARMLHQAGFRLLDRKQFFSLPLFRDVVTSQKWVSQTLGSPRPLKALARVRVRVGLGKVILVDGIASLKGLSEDLKGYLTLSDLQGTSPYDVIIREDTEILLNERYPEREQSRALHKTLFWVY